MIHVAILQTPYLDAILEGRKTIEMRLTRTNRVPFEAVEVGERVYFKQSGGPFRATAVVEHAMFRGDLKPADLARVRRDYNEWIGADAAFWNSRRDCRFCTLLWLRDIERVRFGPRMRPHHGVAWQCLPESADVYPACVERGEAKAPAGSNAPPKGESSAPSSDLELNIPLTAGNLRHGHVYLARHLDRFPADAFGGPTRAQAGRALRLHLDGAGVIETDIVRGRGIFRSRAWRGWFARSGAQPGDHVRLKAVGPRDFQVSLLRGAARP